MFEKQIDREEFRKQFELWYARKIKISEGMEKCKMKGRHSWYRIARELNLLK